MVGLEKVFFLFCVLLLLSGCVSHKLEEQGTGVVKEFFITAKDWEFTPTAIQVSEGDIVVLHVKTIEGIHGFMIPDFGINERLDPGEEVTLTFVANKKGTFPFVCSVYCGKGHIHMKGILVVE